MPDVKLPDGRIVKNVPEGTTKEELIGKLKKAGRLSEEQANEFLLPQRQLPQEEINRLREESLQAQRTGDIEEARNLAKQAERGKRPATFSPGELALGAVETGVTFGSGMVAAPVAGLSGLIGMIPDAVSGEGDVLGNAAQRIKKWRDILTIEPDPTKGDVQTTAGRQITEDISAPFRALQKTGRAAGSQVLEATGSPAAATATQLGVEALPEALSFGGVRPRARARRTADIQRVEEGAGELGVDLRGRPEEQVAQIREAGERVKGGQQVRGEDLEFVQESVMRARERTKQLVDRLYENARAKKAGVPSEQMRELPEIVRESLATRDIENMPTVQTQLKKLNNLLDKTQFPEGSAVPLRKIDDFRRGINDSMPPKSDPKQRAAMTIIKSQLDTFLDAKFNADMIRGDKTAINAWKRARRANKGYRKRFRDNKVIKQLAEQQADPEDIRRWLYGANAVGAKKEAAQVLRRIKKIVGEDSPEMAALRNEIVFDVVDPLFQDRPNLNQFVKNYDRLIENRPKLSEEILTNKQLKNLRDLANSIKRRDTNKVKKTDIDMAAGALLNPASGAQLSRAGVIRRGISDLFQVTRESVTGKSTRKQIIGDVLGYDPTKPMLSKAPVQIGGISETAKETEQEQ